MYIMQMCRNVTVIFAHFCIWLQTLPSNTSSTNVKMNLNDSICIFRISIDIAINWKNKHNPVVEKLIW